MIIEMRFSSRQNEGAQAVSTGPFATLTLPALQSSRSQPITIPGSHAPSQFGVKFCGRQRLFVFAIAVLRLSTPRHVLSRKTLININPNDLVTTECRCKVRARRQRLVLLGVLLLTMIGCQRNSDEAATITTEYSNQPATSGADGENSALAKSTAKEKAAEVEIEVPVGVQFASWEQAEQVAKSTGKITVLDVWSTVCAPCIKELPGLVDLHQELGDKVQCMTLDVDFDGRKSKPPSTYEKDVLSLLTSLDANFPNYICTTSSDDVYAAAEIDSIPAVLVFDANGKLAKTFVDAGESAGFGYHKDVIPFVKSLIEG